MYKSKIILSSLTVLGLAGTGFLGSNYINSVNAETDHVKENIKQQIETLASQVDKAKPKEEVKSKSTVYAEGLKPEEVHEQLINNAVSESEDLKNEDIKSEDVKEEVVEEVKSETTTEQAEVISNETNNEVQETPIVEPVVETKVDEVVSKVKEEVKEESPKLEDTSINEVVDTKVETEKPVVEETNVEAPVAETPVVEEKHEDVKALDEIKPVETTTEVKEEPKAEPVVEQPKEEPKVEETKVETPVVEEKHEDVKALDEIKPVETTTEVKEEPKAEPVVEQPKEEPKVEETKVETPVVEAVASKPTLTNPINDKINTYPIGQCTWGVKTLADWVGNYWGNANEWGASARKAGYTTGSTPQVGSVIVFPNVIYEGINYGHVAYVTHVYDDGSIEVLEANYLGNQSIGNYRGRFNPNQPRYGGVYYIYPNA